MGTAGPLPPTGDGSMSRRTLADLAFSPAFWFDASFAPRNICKCIWKSTVFQLFPKEEACQDTCCDSKYWRLVFIMLHVAACLGTCCMYVACFTQSSDGWLTLQKIN